MKKQTSSISVLRRVGAFLITLSMLLVFVGCASKDANDMGMAPENMYAVADTYLEDGMPPPTGKEESDTPIFVENPFISTHEQAVSTFSADVDTASYTYFRKLVNNNYALADLKNNGAAFRTEEFVNYFKYNANGPAEGELFGVTTAIAECPWNTDAMLMRLTLQAQSEVAPVGNNLVFLIDVSGSMSSSDKLPLLKKAFSYLVSQLNENDRVSIVTYSGKESVVLSGCPGNQGEKILSAIEKLKANGSTNGQAGLEKAYREAQEYMIEGGNNRIIMASDGDLNVGISSAEELKAFVEQKRELGIYLSVLGFGTGNYRDANMEALADNGNGVYYYIDGESEAERIFGSELLSTLQTVANDVKLQITFDPAAIASYRLIGYENRILREEDFTDDTKDAGEVGAGHQITVCYELIPAVGIADNPDWMTLKVRYKPIGASESTENQYPIGATSQKEPDADFRFITAVIETAMVLHNSKYLGDINLHNVLDILNSLDLSSAPARAEFKALIQKIGG